MTRLIVEGHPFQIDLIIFDKDGTLIDFHQLWARRAIASVQALAEAARGDTTMVRALFAALGFDASAGRTMADGPLAMATMEKLYTIAAAVLYQHGHPWHQAEALVRDYFVPLIDARPEPDDIRQLGDIANHFTLLRRAGLRLALATSDNRPATETALERIGVANQVELMACGDDAGPRKPAPEIVWEMAAHFGVAPQQVMVVGDTTGDMQMGILAGVGATIGVANGAGNQASLAANANVVVTTIEAIRPDPA